MASLTRRIVSILAMGAVLLASGCSPLVYCQVETTVYPDYSCQRVTRMEAYPNQRFQGQRPRLSDFYNFPPAEYYDSYAVQQDKVLFAGLFDSFEKIPSDLVRMTPGSSSPAGNLMSFRVMDLVLFVLADFDETITDIVKSREDGEAALDELLRLAIPEVMSVLNAKYGAKYDLSRLDAWLNNDLPMKLRRIYAAAWAIHGAKRSGVTSPGEDFEYYVFLKEEAKREGIELADYGTPDMQQENIRRLKEYAIRLATSLCPPRPGVNETGKDALANIAVDDLLASVQMAITARHGSINNYISKIAALVPRAFGAYMTGTVMPIYMLPETQYQFRLRSPGRVIQTNGVQELNGDLVWSFTDRDIALTGLSMWCRTIFVREPAAYSLGLRGFPATLADVDRMFGLCLAPDGTPRENLLAALRQGVAVRSLAPVEALAGGQTVDAGAAKDLLELFQRHRKSAAAAQVPEQSPAAAPPVLPEPDPNKSKSRAASDPLAPVQSLQIK